MKRNKCLLLSSVISLLCPLAAQAEDLNIDFKATVTATTCSMALESLSGTNITGDQTAGYVLTMGNVGMDKITKLANEAQRDFKLVATNCSPDMTSITTQITSGAATGNLIHNVDTATGASTNVGMGFKRQSTAGETYLTPGTTTMTWTPEERTAGELAMTVALRELTKGQGTIGHFNSKATFNFTYQ